MNLAVGVAVYKVAAYNVENADIDSQKITPVKEREHLPQPERGTRVSQARKQQQQILFLLTVAEVKLV